MAHVIVVNDTTTRAELVEALGWLNDTAKTMRRRGHTGTASAEYARTHGRIDAILSELVGE